MGTNDVLTWNRRARWCLLMLSRTAPEQRGDPVPEQSPARPPPVYGLDLVLRARECLRHWAACQAACLPRALAAAAHQGLVKGQVEQAVKQHRAGLLALSGPVGTGKTVGLAHLAYRSPGPMLWINAVDIALARPETMRRWLEQIPGAGVALVDDVGAAGTVGQWESPRIAAILTACAARRGPSAFTTNLSLTALVRAYDHEHGGRLDDRLTMRPNRWVDVPQELSRRSGAEEPPEGLPRRELRAQAFLDACAATELTGQALVMADVDQRAMRLVADRLGIKDVDQLDRACDEHDAARGLMTEAMAALRQSWSMPEMVES